MNFSNSTVIKVIGIGGEGCNAISRMMQCRIQGVDLIALNCDVQDLQNAKAHQKVRIGKNLTKGLGAGMNPEIGKAAAQEQKEEITEILKGSDMVFITWGLGGGTGTGAGPVVAEIAKSLGILTVVVATKPFSFEGQQRAKITEKGLENLKDKVDTLLIIANDQVLRLVERNVTVSEAFWAGDEVLREAVQGISDLIVLPGMVNVDFADVKTIMKDSGPAFFGQGRARGERRIEMASNLALNSPLLDFTIQKAKGVLFNVSGSEDLTLTEVEEAAKIITKNIDPKSKVIFGAVQDKRLKKNEVKITLIATGFTKMDGRV